MVHPWYDLGMLRLVPADSEKPPICRSDQSSSEPRDQSSMTAQALHHDQSPYWTQPQLEGIREREIPLPFSSSSSSSIISPSRSPSLLQLSRSQASALYRPRPKRFARASSLLLSPLSDSSSPFLCRSYLRPQHSAEPIRTYKKAIISASSLLSSQPNYLPEVIENETISKNQASSTTQPTARQTTSWPQHASLQNTQIQESQYNQCLKCSWGSRTWAFEMYERATTLKVSYHSLHRCWNFDKCKKQVASRIVFELHKLTDVF